MMHKLISIVALNFLAFTPLFLYSQLPGKPPTTLHGPKPEPFPKPKPEPKPPEPPIQRRFPPRPPEPTMGTPPFALPGIVGVGQGGWAGSDNLYNLRPNITVHVELVMLEDQKFNVSEHEIKSHIQEIFSRTGITPYAIPELGGPPLPFYHVLVMLNAVDDCMTACCACRLFESVKLNRVILEQGITFQSITWEKQDLISASRKDFYPLLNKTITDITEEFVERFQYFQNLRFQRQGNRL